MPHRRKPAPGVASAYGNTQVILFHQSRTCPRYGQRAPPPTPTRQFTGRGGTGDRGAPPRAGAPRILAHGGRYRRAGFAHLTVACAAPRNVLSGRLPGRREQLFAVSPAIPLGGGGRDIEMRESFSDSRGTLIARQISLPDAKSTCAVDISMVEKLTVHVGPFSRLPGRLGTCDRARLPRHPRRRAAHLRSPLVILVFAGGLGQLAPG